MMAYDGTIRIDTRIDERGLNKGINSIAGSLGKLGAAMAAAFGAAALVSFGKSAVDVAAQMSNAFVGLESVVSGQGKSFDQAKKFINDFIADGLVPAADAVTAYKNLAMRGYDTTQIEKTLIALKDSAAFGRQASLTLGDAVRGASEGLKNENSILVDNAGVTKNVSMMWKEYAEQIGTTVGMLTTQQKIQAEVNGIMNESRFQTGDAAKLAGTYSGQLSALGVSLTNLKVAIGNIIIPILQKIMPAIKIAVDGLVFFFNQVAQIVNLLLGTNIGAASAAASTAAAMGDVAGSAEGAADSTGKLADNAKAAGKAAKGALAAFDQLNVLQQDTAEAGGSGGVGGGTQSPIGGGGIGLGDIGTDGGVMDTLAEKAEKVRQFLQPLTDAFGRLRDALIPLGKTIWEGLVWAWDNILVPIGTFVIRDVLPRFLDLLALGLENLNLAIVALKPFGLWLWENFLRPAGEWTGATLLSALDWFVARMQEMNKWIKNNQEAFRIIVIVMAAVMLAIFLLSSPIAMLIAGIIALIAVITNWGAIWDWIVAKAKYTWETIRMIWAIVAFWFKANVFDPLERAAVWALTSLLNNFVTVFMGIESFVRGSINRIIEFINGMIRGIVGGINSIISAANAVGKNIPGYAQMSAIPTPQIPRLATGAVIPPNSAFLAVLGDQRSGRNIEAPEGLIRQIMQEEISRIESNVTIKFSGSLAELARLLKPEIDRENTRIGGTLVVGGAA